VFNRTYWCISVRKAVFLSSRQHFSGRGTVTLVTRPIVSAAAEWVVLPNNRSIGLKDPVESLRVPFDEAHRLCGEVGIGRSRGIAFASMKSWMTNVL
jgi:hypothetical protein